MTRTLGLLLILACLFGPSARAATLDLFGAPNGLLCPDLFHTDATIEDRIFGAYVRVLESYRETVSEDEFRRVIGLFLKHRSYYRFPVTDSGSRAIAELGEKIRLAAEKNEFPGGASLDKSGLEKRIRGHLETTVGKLETTTAIVESVREETKKTREIWKVLGDLNTQKILTAKASADLQYAVMTTKDELVLWDLKTGSRIRTMPVEVKYSLTGLEISSDSKKAFGYASHHGVMVLWDLDQGKTLKVFYASLAPNMPVRVSADLKWVLSVSAKGRLELWDTEKGSIVRSFRRGFFGRSGTITSLHVSADFTRALTRSDDGRILVWDLKTGKTRKLGPKVWVRTENFQVDADFKHAYIAPFSDAFQIWDLDTLKLVRSFEVKPKQAEVVNFQVSPDSKRMVTAMTDGTVRVWNFETGELIYTLSGHRGWVQYVVTSKDFRYAISSGYRRHLILWDLENGRLVRDFGEKASGSPELIQVDGEFSRGFSLDTNEYQAKVWNLELVLQGGGL